MLTFITVVTFRRIARLTPSLRDLSRRQHDRTDKANLCGHEFRVPKEHIAIAVKPFGILTNDNQVHRLYRLADAWQRFCGSNVRKQIETFSKVARNIDPAFLGRRIAHVVVRPQDESVRCRNGVDGTLRHRRAMRCQRRLPYCLLIELQA